MKRVYPGSTIGIFGGGQLGKMLTLEAKKMGYKVITLDPTPSSPCARVADEQIIASFDDRDAALNLAKRSDVLTYEFENVNADIIEYLEKEGFFVSPSSQVLKITQNRIKEKKFLRSQGILTTDFRAILKSSQLEEAREKPGLPAVLKTATSGYDGKGQIVLREKKDVEKIPESLTSRKLIWEKWVPFVKEISVICTRGARGEIKTFPVSENIHRSNILHMSIVPARIPTEAKEKAVEIAKKVAEKLKAIGTIGIEMFLLEEGTIMVNEIAPRVHNSGHYSIEACYTSQFEQHLRAICGLPLGSTKLLSAVVMVNILGEELRDKKTMLSGIDKALAIPGVNLHLYGKDEVRAGRKMGHITVLADSVPEAIRRAEKAKNFLCWS